MEEEKITLDRKSFRALASDTRVSILKSLDRRRKMLTELSRQLSMSPSTVKEHMDNLSEAGLVVQIDDGHKWKYYELTSKGKNILHPEYTKIWILLSVSVLGFMASAWSALSALRLVSPMSFATYDTGLAQRAAETAVGEKALGEAAPAIADASLQTASQFPFIQVLGMVLFGIIAAVCIARIVRRG